MEESEHLYIVGRDQVVTTTMESTMEISQKIKNGSTVCFINLPSGYISKEDEISISKRYLHSYSHCSIIHNSQDTETVNGFINKESVLYTFGGILFSHK